MTANASVLVGLSPRRGSLTTLTWAAERAGRTEAPLRVVLAAHDVDDASGAMREIVTAVAEIRSRFPWMSLNVSLSRDQLAESVLNRCGSSQLVVVDQDLRRHSTVTTIAAQATCPVIAVNPHATWSDETRLVVVGADGTERSESALHWAFAEAHRLHAAVRVVHCQPNGSIRHGHKVFDRVAPLAARYPEVDVQVQNLAQPPADALAWHSQYASMLVIGHSERPVAGRVCRSVMRRSACPVVVVGPHIPLAADASVAHALNTMRSSR